VGQYLIRLDRVAGIALDRSDSLFRVVVTHTDSTPPFEIWVKNQDDVERFADAIAALSGVKPRVARPPSEA
jgi:hypothetical protein